MPIPLTRPNRLKDTIKAYKQPCIENTDITFIAALLVQLYKVGLKMTKVNKTNTKTTSNSLEAFEKQVLAMVKTIDLQYFNLDKYIQDNGFNAEKALKAEREKALIEFEKQILSMVKTIDLQYFNLDQYIIDQGFSTEKIETVKETENLALQVFKLAKETKTKNLAFELAKTSKTLENKNLSFKFGNGYIEYYLFFHLLHKNINETKKAFKLNKVLEFTNQYLPNYSSTGHYNHLNNLLCKIAK